MTARTGNAPQRLTDCATLRNSSLMPFSAKLPPMRLIPISYVLSALALLGILYLHLLPVLLAGLLVFALVNALAPSLQRHLPGAKAHWLVVALLAAIVVGLLSFAIVGGIAYLGSEHGNPSLLFERMAPLIERARAQLPAIVVDHMPDNSEEIRVAVMGWLREHASQLQLAGANAARVILHLLIGMVLGAMLALQSALDRPVEGPLTQQLRVRAINLATAFRDIVFAQLKISALNTLFTAIFLLIVLPFIGNLISNTLIFVIGLSVSLWVAIAALTFLIVIHKLEYFLNARIIGGQIRARAWQLLIAMLVMEAAFGLAGVVAAPIYFAYLKRELEGAGLV